MEERCHLLRHTLLWQRANGEPDDGTETLPLVFPRLVGNMTEASSKRIE